MRDGQGGSGETRPGERDPAHRPGPPRIFPPTRIPPSQWDIPGDHPVAESPRCPAPCRLGAARWFSGGGGYCRLVGFCDRGRDRPEEWDMESWMDMTPCWELETECDFIYLPLDGKGTDIVGTQLPAGQAEMQSPGGEPDLISRTIDGGGRPAGICIGLVSLHCLLELDMSWVPNSLARSEPVVDSWNIGGLFSVWPLVWGWYPEERLTVTSRSLKKAFQTQETNCGPRSETTSSEMPKVRKRLWKRASAVSRAVGKPRRGINVEFWWWRRLSIHKLPCTGRHPGPYWATSTELGGAREYAGCPGVQSPGKHAGSPEG